RIIHFPLLLHSSNCLDDFILVPPPLELIRMREIVTIQVGDYANYIGSHFWNVQDELLGLAEDPGADPVFKNGLLDMDVFYRAGETQQGIFTYCPRMISIGSRGSLGSLSTSGTLYGNIPSADSMAIATWTGNAARSVAEPYKKNLFLQSLSEEDHDDSGIPASDSKEGDSSHRRERDKDRIECLENGVNSWTDYSKVQYHPKTLYELKGSWADVNKFDDYGIGRDVIAEGSHAEEMNERLRFFIEECDHIQGIQFIVDDSGGFSSVAVEYLENIADEYANTPVLLYNVRDPVSHALPINQRGLITRALHDAVSFSKLASFSKLMVPVGLPSLRSNLSPLLHVKDEKLFYSSAIYAAAIHSISVPFRLEPLRPSTNSTYASGALEVGEIVHLLAGQARQNPVTILDLAMPVPSFTEENNWGSILKYLNPLTPEIGEDDEDPYAVESVTVHGALHSGCNRASISQVKNSICAEYEGRSIKLKFLHLSMFLCPLPIPLPFPSIFTSRVGRHGELLEHEFEGGEPKGSLDVESVPIAARLRSSKAILPFIETRYMNLHKYGLARGSRGDELLRDWGFGREEVEDMGENMSRMLLALDPLSEEASSDSD
ncbi:Protein misato, partial [Ananas comosus]